jgi:hypothetical protein
MLIWPKLEGFRTTAIGKVSTDLVGRITQDCSDDGAVEVTVRVEADGRWTVIAGLPEDADEE